MQLSEKKFPSSRGVRMRRIVARVAAVLRPVQRLLTRATKSSIALLLQPNLT